MILKETTLSFFDNQAVVRIHSDSETDCIILTVTELEKSIEKSTTGNTHYVEASTTEIYLDPDGAEQIARELLLASGVNQNE